MGTVLEIAIFSERVDETIIQKIFSKVEDFEKKYSRFIKWNYLSKLNEEKEAEIDEDFLTIINISKKVHELTKWYFDITVLPFLENIWYGIEEKKLENNIWMKNILIENGKIVLKNNVSIEIWWIGKWYMIDVIYDILREKYNDFIINII